MMTETDNTYLSQVFHATSALVGNGHDLQAVEKL